MSMFNCYYGNEVQQGHLRGRCLSIKQGRLSGAVPVWFQHHEGKVLPTLSINLFNSLLIPFIEIGMFVFNC